MVYDDVVEIVNLLIVVVYQNFMSYDVVEINEVNVLIVEVNLENNWLHKQGKHDVMDKVFIAIVLVDSDRIENLVVNNIMIT